MDDLTNPSVRLAIGSSISAVLAHQFIFKRVEVDNQPGLLVTCLTMAFAYLVYSHGFSLALLTCTSFFGTLWASILAYRAFFHPLHHFPGPFAAKLSKFWTIKQVLGSKFRLCDVLGQLQEQYGDYVRTGPRELTIFDVAAIQAILGPNSKTSKGPFYNSMEVSVHMTRDRAFHKQRRKIWDNAMKHSLGDYAPRVEQFTDQLVARIAKTAGSPVPLNDFCIHYSYDVMSALAFGKPMGFNEGKSTQVARDVVQNTFDGIHALGTIYHVPWLLKILTKLSSFAGPLKLWNDWSQQQLNERKELKDPPPDIMMHLLANTKQDAAGDHLLFSESRLVISAGSDTTATALTFIFIHLALYPECVKALRAEIDANFHQYSCQQSQPYLDAVINESMRLHPSVFFATQRVVPKEGLKINEKFIPGDTIVSFPTFRLARDERNFVRAQEFIPERWTTKPELVVRRSAFVPFLTGPYVCAGKPLAYMEMRSVVTKVIKDYDVKLPKGFDRDMFFAGVQDHFVAGAPKQQVIFAPRGDGAE